MIERLVIHRFRGIREGVLKDLGKVNLLIGPHNGGKTTILEATYLAATSRLACKAVMPDVPGEDGGPAVFEAAVPVENAVARVKRRHGIKDASPATQTPDGISIDLSPLSEIFLEGIDSSPGMFSIYPPGVPICMLPMVLDTAGVTDEALLHYVYEPGLVHDGPGELPLAVMASEGEPPYHVRWFDLLMEEPDQRGEGDRHADGVRTRLQDLCESVDEAHPGLFLWEYPELFMHPASLNRLLREVLRLTKDKPIQVFLSSQSIETTALLTAHIEEMKLQSDYRVLRLDLQDGKLYAAKYHYKNVIAWLDAGMDPRFW